MFSYLFVSMAYGIMMEEAGFKWYYALFISMTVYTGAFQFLPITFLSSGASILTIALMAFLMNSRQVFYSLTFVDEFRGMGKKMLYMIHTMTDETYAVNLTLDSKGKEKEDTMFLIALLSRCYWMIGAVTGGILGQVIPFDLKGIDFCKKYDMIVAARKRAIHNNAAWLAAPQGKAGLWRQNAWKR